MDMQTNVGSKKQNIIVSVSGLIGSGKSTIIKYIQTARPYLPIFLEDVENWFFLEPFYKNPKEYALLFQLDLLTRFRALEKYEFLISERTSADSRYIFAQCLYQDKILSEKEWILYQRAYKTQQVEPQVILYLDVTIEQQKETKK